MSGIAKEYYFEKRKSLKVKFAAKKVALKKMWQTASRVQPVIRYAKLLLDPIEFHALNKRQQQQVTNFVRKAPALSMIASSIALMENRIDRIFIRIICTK